jgi:hypothetical protein
MGARIVTFVTLAAFALSGFAQMPAPPPPGGATTQPPGAATQPAAAVPQGQKTFSQEELEQLVAPIALYPDSLLVQTLMASTYPLEIVSAERCVKANPNLKDKALEDALANQSWDASVKSLAVFPQVLTMMSEKLDWTQKLGDAFLAQQQDVMATAQALRSKAVAQGTLKDSKEQKVVTEKVESTTVIKIEPTNPEVVYVPTYNPTVVYGAWPYPAYPPYYYYPPGYVAGGALLGFTAGVIVGGALWGGANWGRNEVNVNVNRYNNFNKTNISNGNWQHNGEHRGAVPYKDKGVAQQYNRGGAQNAQAAQARADYRGRDGGTAQARPGEARSGGTGAIGDRGASAQSMNRDMSGTRGGSAFDSGSRAQASNYSSRGSSSMSSSARSSGMSSGGARSGGGGGARGGGGRGGGGRR